MEETDKQRVERAVYLWGCEDCLKGCLRASQVPRTETNKQTEPCERSHCLQGCTGHGLRIDPGLKQDLRTRTRVSFKSLPIPHPYLSIGAHFHPALSNSPVAFFFFFLLRSPCISPHTLLAHSAGPRLEVSLVRTLSLSYFCLPRPLFGTRANF